MVAASLAAVLAALLAKGAALPAPGCGAALAGDLSSDVPAAPGELAAIGETASFLEGFIDSRDCGVGSPCHLSFRCAGLVTA